MAKYKADTPISMSVATQYIGSEDRSTATVEYWTGLTQSEIDAMSDDDVKKALDDALADYVAENCKAYWKIKD